MNIDDVARNEILSEISRRFPFYPVRLQDIDFDSKLVGIGVFNVPADSEKEIESFISDYSFDNCHRFGCHLIPMVRGMETTRKYYPEFSVGTPD